MARERAAAVRSLFPPPSVLREAEESWGLFFIANLMQRDELPACSPLTCSASLWFGPEAQHTYEVSQTEALVVPHPLRSVCVTETHMQDDHQRSRGG